MEKYLVNAHAKSRLTPETCGHSGQKTRARLEPPRDQTQAIPCKVRAVDQLGAISLELVSVGATLGAIGANDLRRLRTDMNSGQGYDRGHGPF